MPSIKYYIIVNIIKGLLTYYVTRWGGIGVVKKNVTAGWGLVLQCVTKGEEGSIYPRHVICEPPLSIDLLK